MRQRYAEHRAAMARALDAEHLPEARMGDSAAGLFELVELPPGTDEARVVAAAAARGVGVEGLALHCFAGDRAPALVLGYGGLGPAALEHAVALLGESAAQARALP